MDRLRVGGHAVDVRGTALDVVDRMGLGEAVRDARTRILTLSAVRSDGRRRYDVRLRSLHEVRDREIEVMRDDLVRILFDAVAGDVEVVFGDAYLSIIYTVDNVLDLRDQAVLYNEPGRGAAVFTVRGNSLAKVVLLFRSGRIGIDPADRLARCDLLRRRFSGMGWETTRLLDLLDGAHDYYVDEMAQVRMPRSLSAGPSPRLGARRGDGIRPLGVRLSRERHGGRWVEHVGTRLPAGRRGQEPRSPSRTRRSVPIRGQARLQLV